jgi:hypothetical protein
MTSHMSEQLTKRSRARGRELAAEGLSARVTSEPGYARSTVVDEARKRARVARRDYRSAPTFERLQRLEDAVRTLNVAIAVRAAPSQRRRAKELAQRELAA